MKSIEYPGFSEEEILDIERHRSFHARLSRVMDSEVKRIGRILTLEEAQLVRIRVEKEPD